MKTKIMGVLNVTPDSYYEPSRVDSEMSATQRAIEIVEQGAHIIDIGGESTRPFSDPVPLEVELERTIPIIKALKKTLSIPLSIDTKKPEVAMQAVNAGVSCINDISGFTSEAMRAVAKKTKVDLCLMHMQNDPKIMQVQPYYEKGVVIEVLEWLDMQSKILMHEGVDKDRIILDPGIGFGKTVEDNLEILRNIDQFFSLGFRLLVGVSRKSFMAKLLNKSSNELLAATLAVDMQLIQKGVDYIRVHDVQEHKDALEMCMALQKR